MPMGLTAGAESPLSSFNSQIPITGRSLFSVGCPDFVERGDRDRSRPVGLRREFEIVD
jgi:hypothetical protein